MTLHEKLYTKINTVPIDKKVNDPYFQLQNHYLISLWGDVQFLRNALIERLRKL